MHVLNFGISEARVRNRDQMSRTSCHPPLSGGWRFGLHPSPCFILPLATLSTVPNPNPNLVVTQLTRYLYL